MAYFSKKLLTREQKYATIEKECLAIKLGMETFRVYLLGKEFTIQMDHRALKWLTRFKDNNNRLMRWSFSIQPFQFQVQHRKGIGNANTDALSREAELDGQSEPEEGGRGVEEGQITKGQRLSHDLAN